MIFIIYFASLILYILFILERNLEYLRNFLIACHFETFDFYKIRKYNMTD